MAKRPLRAWMRDKLLNHIKEIVVPAREKRALDAAYAKAAPMVTTAIRKKYPEKDMALLERYGVASRYGEAKLQSPAGQVVLFTFVGEDCPFVPCNSEYRQIYLTDAATVAAIEKHGVAKDAFAKERERRIVAFRMLISSAQYVEDVTDVWPEAGVILPATAMTAPIAPEDIATIKADVRERAAA